MINNYKTETILIEVKLYKVVLWVLFSIVFIDTVDSLFYDKLFLIINNKKDIYNKLYFFVIMELPTINMYIFIFTLFSHHYFLTSNWRAVNHRDASHFTTISYKIVSCVYYWKRLEKVNVS